MKLWLVIGGVVGVLVIAGILFLVGRERGVESGQEGSAQRQSTTSESTSAEVVFTEPIVDPATIKNITPLGELNGGYNEVQTLAGVMVNFKPEAVAGNTEVEVRAPTDMTLERYSFHKVDYPPGGNWALIFRLNRDVTMRMDHISRASDAIVAATTSTPKESSADEAPKQQLKVKAGEVIGYTFGTVPAHNWNI
ncbi:hypothetical protein HY374_02865, partial [Candidatus Berkelbacteria bacterium]|nr:hypothetical protein [Candidatus Berkelbacteria bacterium]